MMKKKRLTEAERERELIEDACRQARETWAKLATARGFVQQARISLSHTDIARGQAEVHDRLDQLLRHAIRALGIDPSKEQGK